MKGSKRVRTEYSVLISGGSNGHLTFLTDQSARENIRIISLYPPWRTNEIIRKRHWEWNFVNRKEMRTIHGGRREWWSFAYLLWLWPWGMRGIPCLGIWIYSVCLALINSRRDATRVFVSELDFRGQSEKGSFRKLLVWLSMSTLCGISLQNNYSYSL